MCCPLLSIRRCVVLLSQLTPVLSLCSQSESEFGELLMSLRYLPTAGRLTVTVLRARHLRATDVTGKTGRRADQHQQKAIIIGSQIYRPYIANKRTYFNFYIRTFSSR